MENENNKTGEAEVENCCMPGGKCCRKGKWKHHGGGGAGGGVYGLAFLGALVYYIQMADSFWMGVVGVLKAIIWPAIVVYRLLEFLGL